MPLAYEESAFELLDVTLAQEDDRPGVPDQTEVASSTYSSHIDLEINILKLATVWSTLTIQIIVRDMTGRKEECLAI